MIDKIKLCLKIYYNHNYKYKSENWNLIEELTIDESNELFLKLRKIDYNKFLLTWYWRTITHMLRKTIGNVCVKCKRKKYKIHVHHKTYDYHGMEHLHLDSLMILCEKCHNKIPKFNKEILI